MTGLGGGTVSVIVVSYNTRELTLAAVASALEQRGVELDVWVVDNASGDGSAAALRERFPQVHVVELEENVGFGRANNVAFERARGARFLLLNSDARLRDPDGLARLVEALEEDAAVGVVGPRLENDEGRLEYSARVFPDALRELERRTGLYRLRPRRDRERRFLSDFFAHERRVEVDWLTGACLLLRREVWEEVGGFDPDIFMYGEEQEWCWRIRRAGWRIVFDPRVTVLHRRAASSPERLEWRMKKGMEGDLHLFRRHAGAPRRAAFVAARLAGLAVEASLFGLAGRVRPSPYRADRARAARMGLRAFWSVATAGRDDG